LPTSEGGVDEGCLDADAGAQVYGLVTESRYGVSDATNVTDPCRRPLLTETRQQPAVGIST
jgi:hypothetical protein